MKQKLAAAMVAMGFALSPALAQQAGPQPTLPPTNAPIVTTPAPGAPAVVGTAGQMWYSSTGNVWRSSKLVGTGVQNAAGERIGEINEIIVGNDGRVHAVVLGIGGFLGIGEREVAVNYSALNMTRDASGNPVITVNATRETLQGAPRWTWSSAAR